MSYARMLATIKPLQPLPTLHQPGPGSIALTSDLVFRTDPALASVFTPQPLELAVSSAAHLGDHHVARTRALVADYTIVTH